MIRGTKIQCICPLGTRGINVVFETREQAEQAERAQACPDWISTGLIGATLMSEEWCPVKCDEVAKQTVLDETAKDGRTLRREVLERLHVPIHRYGKTSDNPTHQMDSDHVNEDQNRRTQ